MDILDEIGVSKLSAKVFLVTLHFDSPFIETILISSHLVALSTVHQLTFNNTVSTSNIHSTNFIDYKVRFISSVNISLHSTTLFQQTSNTRSTNCL